MTRGIYNSTAPTLGDGADQHLQLDASGNLKATLATTIAGEDITNDVLKTEQRFSYATAFGAGTTVIKSGAGFLHRVIVSANAGTCTVYDNSVSTSTGSASRVLDFDVQPNSTMTGTAIHENHEVNATFASGIIVGNSTASMKITVIYR